MNTVQVKNTVIGEGRPKICVPIVGKTKTDILEEPGDDEIHVNVHIGQADPEHEAMAVAGALGL